MFTFTMYDRLSDWLANLSVVFMAVLVVPFFQGDVRLTVGEVFRGLLLSGAFLWSSLRCARISSGR